MRAAGWDERYRAEPLLWSAGPNPFLVEEVAGLPPGRALDVACGEGRNALWLADQGWSVTAVDFSVVAVERGRRLAGDRGLDVEWVVADVLSYVPAGSTYDLVALLYLHLPAADRRRALAQAAAAVAPGGMLLVVGHDTTNLTEGAGGPRDASVLFTPADIIEDLAGQPGLVAERAEVVRRATGDGQPEALDALVRLRRS